MIVLDEQGQCVGLEPIGERQNGRTVPSETLVTAIGKQAMKHTNSGKDANLLWDNASFVFGTGNKGKVKLASFLDALTTWFAGVNDLGVEAVRTFCLNLQSNPESVSALSERFHVKEDFEKRDPVLVFRLVGDVEYVHMRPAVRHAYEGMLPSSSSDGALQGNCLVTGEIGVRLAPNESVIKGVWGGQQAGCNIVSFNARAFESYGKRNRNGENAPISLRASFAYTTALNHLLAKGSRQRIQVGDASTVFWAEAPHELEGALADLFGESPKDDPDRGTDALRALYRAVETGRFALGGDDTRFYVLGLAPNAARIAVRFWETAPAIELARRIKRHFDDIAVARSPRDPEHLSLFRLLAATAVQGKADNIPPNLGGEVMRAILEALPYPATLLNAAVQRCRAEQQVSYPRAAAIKGWLNRDARRRHLPQEEFPPMLDPDHQSAAYRLGRLFAVLEKIQEEASPGLNATIRDRYYGAASATPVAVFTTLLRLKNHHLGKLNPGRATQMEKLIGEIMAGVEDFPRHLNLPDQGRFALGYYHQRQAFFTRRAAEATETESTQGEPV
ncbi:MAG: hypothetical protein IOMNBAOH_00036 [Rhodocyclaceae bacterium]|nr:hypothetical protein [Rhodocyclaceae bacterium]